MKETNEQFEEEAKAKNMFHVCVDIISMPRFHKCIWHLIRSLVV